MRLAASCLVLLTGCASLPPADTDQQSATAVNPALSARADSLLALPRDSVSLADDAWLTEYQERRYAEATRQDQRREGKTLKIIGGGLTVVAVLILFGVSS